MSSDTAVDGVPMAPADDEPSRVQRWSDRLNPILVREVRQAMSGRVFVLTVLLALAVSTVIAIVVASAPDAAERGGRMAFNAGLATLAPLLLFIVPMQAYASMRLELRGGTVEQLFLSGLRPSRILLGKMLAAFVQFLLYLSVLAPLLATSYLLRGVDLPLIALSIGFSLVLCMSATAFAISSAAHAMAPALQTIGNIGAAFGLGVATMTLTGYCASGECARDLAILMREPEFPALASALVLLGLAATVLSALVAQTYLLHAFENRATGFRLFLLALTPVAALWQLLPARSTPITAFGILYLLMLGNGLLGLFGATETRALSPRVRAHVPRHPLLALLMAPLLPGRDRGMLFHLLMLAVLGGGVLVVRQMFIGSVWSRGFGVVWTGSAAYVLFYLSVGKALRARLPESLVGSNWARAIVPLLVVAACLLPLLVDVLLRGSVGQWHAAHALNPFWTIANAERSDDAAIPFGIALAVLAALQLPSAVRGVREVLVAAAARRARGSARGESSTKAGEPA